MDDPNGLYKLLGLSPDCTRQQIVKAFRKRALKEHPDKGGDEEKFKELARAYEILSDEKSRQRYDVFGDVDAPKREETAEDAFLNAFFGDEARASDCRSGDYGLHSVANYDIVSLTNVSELMKDIVKVGLNYIISLDLNPDPSIVFLQHSRIDILYVMAVYEPPLTQESFDGAYVITYYDNPLQAGITPKWSDQNISSGQRKSSAARRELNREELLRRMENDPMIEDPLEALGERYARLHLREERQNA